MLSRLLINIFLLIIVVTLGLFIYISSGNNEVENRLTTLDKSSVTHITISHNARTVVLEKIAGHWRMLQPVTIDANEFRIGSVLNLLATPSNADYDAASLDLNKLGLATPETSIRFNDLTIAFGTVNPINKNRYVLVNGRVHLIGDQFYPLISSQTGTLVSQYLLPRDAVITGMELPDQTLRKSDIGWQSSDLSITTDAIVATVEHWRKAQAFGVHTYNPRKSLGTIEVTIDSEAAPLIFKITATRPWLIIARPDLGMEYHFNPEFYDRLLRPGVEPEPDAADPEATLPPVTVH